MKSLATLTRFMAPANHRYAAPPIAATQTTGLAVGRLHLRDAAVRLARPAPVFFVLAILATAWLMREGRHFTFIGDDWDWFLHRQGTSLDVWLTPHAEDHLSVLPILAYQALFRIFGATSTVPFRLLSALVGAICAGLLCVLVARRIGGALALAPAAILLFFGPGWSDLLWSFEIGFLGSLAAGFGALLALDRDDRLGDVTAAVLLSVSVACGSVGLMILAGVVVEFLLRVRARTCPVSRLWIPGVPILLYALWYSRYGTSVLHPKLVHLIPSFTFDGIAASAGAITGLAGPHGGPLSISLDPGTTITILLLLVFGVRLLRGQPLSPRFWAMAAAIVAFWSADALGYAPGRGPEASRYTYPVAMFLILAIVEFGPPLRPTVRAAAVLGVASLSAVVSNLGFMRSGANEFAVDSYFSRAELGAMDVAREVVAPSFSPAQPSIATLVGDHTMWAVTAGPYFAAVDRFGDPADSVPRILTQEEPIRQAADLVLVRAERLALQRRTRTAISCTETHPAGGFVELVRGPGLLRLQTRAAGAKSVVLRRFAATFMYASLGGIRPDSDATLWLPLDRSDLPWHVRILTPRPIGICPTG